MEFKRNNGDAVQESANHYLNPSQRAELRSALAEDLSKQQRQRIEIMLLADAGKSRAEICRRLDCSPITARHWIMQVQQGRVNSWRENPVGRPKAIDEAYLARLKELLSLDPKEELGFAFERWTASLLNRRLAKEFGIQLSDRHINRLLNKMGLSTRLPRRSKNKKQPSIIIRNLRATPHFNRQSNPGMYLS